MKASIKSTDQVVTIRDPAGAKALARAWEGVTEDGIPFVAYITMVQVRSSERHEEFERDLQEHKPASAETLRAIDMRFIL
jgi:hypothetical protein